MGQLNFDDAGLAALSVGHRARLASLTVQRLPKGTILFRPGEAAQGFALVISGRVEVFLTGSSGREVLLYAVEPGQSCVQTTLGLLGAVDYAGEAILASDSEIVMIPRQMFFGLMDEAPAFRTYVFGAFADRMQSMMHLLETLAFRRIESRLAAALVEWHERMGHNGTVQATHHELATRIGSVREVVSRRLEAFARSGLVSTDRGSVTLLDIPGLRQIAENIDAG